MKLLKYLIISSLFFIAHSSHAEDVVNTNLIVYGKSYHFNKDFNRPQKKLNETNLGLGIELEKNQFLWGVGLYDDSLSMEAFTLYGGYRYNVSLSPTSTLSLTMKAGYLNGSGFNGLVLMPTAGIGYKINLKDTLFAEMMLLPPIGKKIGNLGFWLRYEM
jgi:hypothetical protein